MSNNDPFVGHVVKDMMGYDYYFDHEDDNKTGLSKKHFSYLCGSLFLVVGIKEKKCYGARNNYYILKPLDNDYKNKNINKELVWCPGVFHICNFEAHFQIVD